MLLHKLSVNVRSGGLAFMALAGLSFGATAYADADTPAVTAADSSCVDARNTARISLLPDQIPWEKHTVIPGVKFKDPNHEPAMTAYLEGSANGAGVHVQLITYPPGISSAPHKHPVAERAYIISGSVNMVVGTGTDKDAIKYPAGSYYTVPANTRHYVFSTEKSEVLLIMGGPYKAEPVADSPDLKLK